MVLLTVLMVIVLMMSVGTLCVHLHRSVREFCAGYEEAAHYATTWNKCSSNLPDRWVQRRAHCLIEPARHFFAFRPIRVR